MAELCIATISLNSHYLPQEWARNKLFPPTTFYFFSLYDSAGLHHLTGQIRPKGRMFDTPALDCSFTLKYCLVCFHTTIQGPSWKKRCILNGLLLSSSEVLKDFLKLLTMIYQQMNAGMFRCLHVFHPSPPHQGETTQTNTAHWNQRLWAPRLELHFRLDLLMPLLTFSHVGCRRRSLPAAPMFLPDLVQCV